MNATKKIEKKAKDNKVKPTEVEKEVKKGKKEESEHLTMYDNLVAYFKDKNKLPSKEEVFKWISLDHIEKRLDYYDILPVIEDAPSELQEHVITNDKNLDKM